MICIDAKNIAPCCFTIIIGYLKKKQNRVQNKALSPVMSYKSHKPCFSIKSAFHIHTHV